MTRFVTCFAVLLATFFGPAVSRSHADTSISISSSSYAAIAFSPSTGEYAYAYNYGSRSAAEQAALARCKPSDAKIVGWVNRGFCALALGDDPGCWGVGYSYGNGSSNTDAKNRALNQCGKHTQGGHIVLCLSSDGQYILE